MRRDRSHPPVRANTARVPPSLREHRACATRHTQCELRACATAWNKQCELRANIADRARAPPASRAKAAWPDARVPLLGTSSANRRKIFVPAQQRHTGRTDILVCLYQEDRPLSGGQTFLSVPAFSRVCHCLEQAVRITGEHRGPGTGTPSIAHQSRVARLTEGAFAPQPRDLLPRGAHVVRHVDK